MVRNSFRHIQLGAYQWYPRLSLQPIRIVLGPPIVDRLIGRKLTWMRLRRTSNRVLPDFRIAGQFGHVLSSLFLVLTVLEQHCASVPEDRRTRATFGLWQRTHAQRCRIGPSGGEA